MRFAVPRRNIRLAGRQRDIVATEASRDADAGDVASVACTVRSAGAVISARFVIYSAPSYTVLRRRDDRATFRESTPCNGSPAGAARTITVAALGLCRYAVAKQAAPRAPSGALRMAACCVGWVRVSSPRRPRHVAAGSGDAVHPSF